MSEGLYDQTPPDWRGCAGMVLLGMALWVLTFALLWRYLA